MKVDVQRRSRTVTWLPNVLELLKQRGHVTANELAAVMGQRHGPDAVTRCKQVGLPIAAVGYMPGKGARRLYALDAPLLWSALDQAVTELNHCSSLRNGDDRKNRLSLRSAGNWIAHIQKKPKGRSRALNS